MGKLDNALEEMDRARESTPEMDIRASYSYTRLQIWLRLAQQAAGAANQSEYRHCLDQALQDAQEVIENSDDEEHRTYALELRAKLSEILTQ